ncbi:MAG: hypothetical protein IJD21_00325 [Oscillospiraceae bacterium]|nr:hypothetical protein [Oscillospiraceae bacterium]
MGISEELFWSVDLAWLASVAANKAAYDAWLGGEREAAQARALKGR